VSWFAIPGHALSENSFPGKRSANFIGHENKMDQR
jgi:hypothetical protein